MNATFDFTKCLLSIEQTGKELYSPSFKVIPEDYEIIFKLLVYFLQDANNAEKYQISLKKDILLAGPVGCGKTSLMHLVKLFLPFEKRYLVKPCRDICFEFSQEGYAVIQKYSSQSFNKDDTPKSYCFDDLGTETNLKYYGNDCNVMAELLLSRYDLFVHRKMRTHITTNLNGDEIGEIYGTRVRSRMREQFNLIAFDENAKDKRF
jgi:energy-coupling factor transporter ATP-binding protein EcfA2